MSIPPSQRSNSISRATPPKWRSSLSTPRKQKASAGVSVVFAQPEPGARLGSAIDRLPVVAVDDAVSVYSVSSRKRERLNSNASSFIPPTEPRSDRGVEQKRSRLNLHVCDDPPNVDGRTAANGMLSIDSPGSVSNPVDLTESPKPMDTSLPSSAQPDEPMSESNPSVDQQLEPQSPPQPQGAVPFPSTDPDTQQTVLPTKSATSRSSWFGFSRAKASDNLSDTLTTLIASSSEPPLGSGAAAESTTVSTHVSNVQETVDLSTSPPAPAAPASSPSRDIHTLPSSIAFPSVAYSPPTPTSTMFLKSNTTSISSVDEEVPVLQNSARTLTPQAVVEPHETNLRAAGRKPSVSSLNPSASRFTLRLPLLGRPKVPLEQAVASAQAEDVREPTETDDVAPADSLFSTSDSVCGDAQNGSGTDTPAVPQVVNVIPPTPGSEPTDPSSSQSHSTPQGEERNTGAANAVDDPNNPTRVRSASWWEYVGWRGQASLEAPIQEQEKPSDDPKDTTQNLESEDRADAQAPQSVELPSCSTMTTQEQNVPPELQGEASSSATETQHELHDTKSDKNPSSILSAEQGPSWYSPWAWYPSGQTPTAAHATEASDGAAVPKTDAEMVKEKALARDEERRVEEDPQPQPQPEPAPAPAANVPVLPLEPVNPIQSSIADNRSGWMSFFMSKSLAVKTVTDGADEGRVEGMEVMELDDEPDPEVAIEVPVGDNKAKATDIQAQGIPKK
ncbi:hypothetical protein V8D89_015164, partial [Ganoderma adspersum]